MTLYEAFVCGMLCGVLVIWLAIYLADRCE